MDIYKSFGVENVVAGHLSRLVIEDTDAQIHITDFFLDEHLFNLNVIVSWYTDIVNYLFTG